MDQQYAEAERRVAEAQATGSTTLDLGDLTLTRLPTQLAELNQLRVLSLGRSAILADGSLETAWKRGGSKRPLEKIDPLAGLDNLEVLDLSGTQIQDLTPLANLKNLNQLDLSGTQVQDLTPLANLNKLKQLDLFGTQIQDLTPLANLNNLDQLNLFSTQIQEITPLANLKNLNQLDLSYTQVQDLTPLANLNNLDQLDLACTQVQDFTPLANLNHLSQLYLYDTQIQDLTPLANLNHLNQLDLAGTQIRDLTPLANLNNLDQLDLAYCENIEPASLLHLPTSVVRLAVYSSVRIERGLLLALMQRYLSLGYLTCDSAHGIPREVLSKGHSDDCLDRLRSYFGELELGAEAETEVKVFLLGNGGVGKTQLCRRLRGELFDPTVESTHGIEIWRTREEVEIAGRRLPFTLNWWDFGGQEIYHGTHGLFLKSRAIFLILWTPHLENREESHEHDIPTRNQPLTYWLDYVKSLAGDEGPVIVVQSQCESFEEELPSPVEEAHRSTLLATCAFGAAYDYNLGLLRAHLQRALTLLRHKTGELEIGAGRAKLRRKLWSLYEADQGRPPEERRHRTLTVDEFRYWCHDVGGIVSWEHALDYLHQTGTLFYRSDLFSNRIILDQRWALDAIYTLFHRRYSAPLLNGYGRFTRSLLNEFVWSDRDPQEQALFLDMMQSCGICFAAGEDSNGETIYYAPDLLPSRDAVPGFRLAWREGEEDATLELEYRFLHHGLIRSLISSFGRQAGIAGLYWKYGLLLEDRETLCKLLVHQIDRSSDENPGAGTILLAAKGHDSLRLLSNVRVRISRLSVGENPSETLRVDGQAVDLSELDHIQDGRVRSVSGEIVDARVFEAFRRGRLDEVDIENERAYPVIGFRRPRIADEPTVFISYAWGDDSPSAKLRGEVVDRLCDALRDDGFRVYRDVYNSGPGDLISQFIDELTKGKHIVAVISERYLESYFCMYEITQIYDRHQGRSELLKRHLFPIVLPEVRLSSFPDRAKYLRHWTRRAKEIEELLADPDVRAGAGPSSIRERMMVRDINNKIDEVMRYVGDVIMPRRLEAHLDDDFQTLRDLLRKRMREADESHE